MKKISIYEKDGGCLIEKDLHDRKIIGCLPRVRYAPGTAILRMPGDKDAIHDPLHVGDTVYSFHIIRGMIAHEVLIVQKIEGKDCAVLGSIPVQSQMVLAEFDTKFGWFAQFSMPTQVWDRISNDLMKQAIKKIAR